MELFQYIKDLIVTVWQGKLQLWKVPRPLDAAEGSTRATTHNPHIVASLDLICYLYILTFLLRCSQARAASQPMLPFIRISKPLLHLEGTEAQQGSQSNTK